MNNVWITGLVPAAFTPLHADGHLHLDQIGPLTEQLIGDGVGGLYVCGSTGEGVSLTSAERREVAAAFVQAADGRVPTIVQVGHNSLAEARLLAEHAQQIGADAISATPPTYFKPRDVETLIDCLAEVTAGAPDLPFYYYHIPHVTGVEVDAVELMTLADERLPSLVGVKFSAFKIFELQAATAHSRQSGSGRFNLLFGSDEMLLSGLMGGAQGAVGSTYNFAAPLYKRVIEAFESGDIDEARRLQGLSVEMVRVLGRRGGNAAIKAVMALLNVDCGPPRLPQVGLNTEQIKALRRDLEAIGFFEWGRA